MPNKRKLQIATNHSSNINFKDIKDFKDFEALQQLYQ